MEIETKAKITEEQAIKIADDDIPGFKISSGGGFRPLFKRDLYFASKNVNNSTIRIREESEIDDPSFLEIIRGKFKDNKLRFKNFLTYKLKRTESGFETNDEIEGEISNEAVRAFKKIMEVCGIDQYFTKTKTSVSFYVSKENEKNDFHVEIVNVNGIGPYLEIEITDNDNIEESKKLISEYFDAIGVSKTDYDNRPWIRIIEEVNNGQ